MANTGGSTLVQFGSLMRGGGSRTAAGGKIKTSAQWMRVWALLGRGVGAAHMLLKRRRPWVVSYQE
jgi:hypothetical protein